MTLIDFAAIVIVAGYIILGGAYLLFKVLFPESYWKDRFK